MYREYVSGISQEEILGLIEAVFARDGVVDVMKQFRKLTKEYDLPLSFMVSESTFEFTREG